MDWIIIKFKTFDFPYVILLAITCENYYICNIHLRITTFFYKFANYVLKWLFSIFSVIAIQTIQSNAIQQ